MMSQAHACVPWGRRARVGGQVADHVPGQSPPPEYPGQRENLQLCLLPACLPQSSASWCVPLSGSMVMNRNCTSGQWLPTTCTACHRRRHPENWAEPTTPWTSAMTSSVKTLISRYLGATTGSPHGLSACASLLALRRNWWLWHWFHACWSTAPRGS